MSQVHHVIRPPNARLGRSSGFDHLESVDDVDTAILDIDQQIKQLFVQRSSLRSHRNTLLPIFRLPPELFSRLFHECILPPCGTDDIAVQLLRITHVCWYWRQVALDDPSLWIQPDFTHPSLGYAMLSRAQHLPLSLSFPYSKDGSRNQLECIDLLLAKKDRIRSLDISAFNFNIHRDFRPLLSGSAPNIEYIRLVSPTGICYLQQDAMPTYAPRLRELILRGCVPPSKMDIFPGLTRLAVSNVYRSSESFLRLPSILAMLCQLPLLVELELRQTCLGLQSNQATHSSLTLPQSTVKMKYLKHLVFEDYSDQSPVGYLLKSVSAPLLERTHILSEVQDVRSLLFAGDWLHSWIGASDHGALDTLMLSWDNSSFRLACTLPPSHTDSEQEQRPPSFDMRINMSSWSAVSEHFFSQLVACDIISTNMMSELTTLDITAVGLDEIRPGWAYNINWKGFSLLRRLENLAMNEIPCWSFFTFIGDTRSTESNRFPALRSLTLRNVIMWQGMDGAVCHDDTQPTLLTSLSNWLRHRISWNMPLDKLELAYCYFLSTPKDELSPLVTTLVIDQTGICAT